MVFSANLTPDKESGIGNWSKEDFIGRFVAFRDSSYAHRKIDIMKDFTSVMPWPVYAGMKDDDLSAIYDYLHSLQPITHKVVKFEPNATAAN